MARAKAKKSSFSLPAPADLERICKGLATLDAIMETNPEYRYYWFDKAWNKKREERLARMRNGEGDDWFIAFSPAGVFVKSYWHEYESEDADTIFDGLPAKLAPFRDEPAFETSMITFGGWHDGTTWTLRGNVKPFLGDLAILTGEAKVYKQYAADYFENDSVPLDAIEHVLAGKKLDAKLVGRLFKGRTLKELKDELAEIGY